MIAKAATVSHGSNAVRYSTEKNLAEIVKVNFLPEDISSLAVWNRMKLLQEQFREKLIRPLKRDSIRIEVSPAQEETVGWTLEDWRKLAVEFIREFDAVDLSKRTKRTSAKSTNLKNSQYVVMLHHDSKSGILHLHINANRIDMNGNVNDDHCIYDRAKEAAYTINNRRGWAQPDEIHKERLGPVTQDCLAALKELDVFDWDAYKKRLETKGYEVLFRLDKEGKIHGYSLKKGQAKYKSSELGHTRRLTPARIEETWAKLHPEKKVNTPAEKPEKPLSAAQEAKILPIPTPKDVSAKIHQDIQVEGKTYSIDIPKSAYEIFLKEAEVPYSSSSTLEQVQYTAMLLFLGYVDGATSLLQSCGGGSSPGSGWGKDPNEDERQWARRCLKKAQELHVRPYRRHR